MWRSVAWKQVQDDVDEFYDPARDYSRVATAGRSPAVCSDGGSPSPVKVPQSSVLPVSPSFSLSLHTGARRCDSIETVVLDDHGNPLSFPANIPRPTYPGRVFSFEISKNLSQTHGC